MKIVIVGDGKVGFSLAERLSQEGHDIVVVDNDAEVLAESQEALDIMVVMGNGASLEVMKDAGVGDSDVLIAVANSDEVNLLCCILAKKLGCKHTIARVRNPEYAQQLLFLKDELGLSLAVNTDLAAAQEIYRMLQFPSFLRRDSFSKGRVELVELNIGEGSKLAGRYIQELEETLGMRVLVCAVERGDQVAIPNGGFKLTEGDRVTVTAARSDLAALVRNLGLVSHKIRGVMIIGGGRTAEYLVDDLLRSGIDVKIIEKDIARCEQLSQRFPDVLIVNGDASHRGFLASEGINGTDAVITLTGIDEENLIISMYADHIGVKKTITKINHVDYAHLFATKGIGSIVCPGDLTVNDIIRYVRAMSNRGEGSVRTLHRIVDGKAEALEFVAAAESVFTGVPLSRLRIKPNILITCITRNGSIIIPSGSDSINIGDTVIVVTTADRTICDLGDIFEKDAVKQ